MFNPSDVVAIDFRIYRGNEDQWIDTAREFDRPIPEPKGLRLQYA